MLETLCVALKGTPRVVVQVLKEKGPLSAGQLVTETGHPEKSVRLALGELEKARLIRRDGEAYTVACRETMAPMGRVPFKNDLGRKVHATTCAECWKKWQAHQLVLMNHFGLNPLDPQAQKFLLGAMESFFFGDGTPPMLIDTSLQGTINHLE